MRPHGLPFGRWTSATVLVAFLTAACIGGPYQPPPGETTKANPLLRGRAGAFVDPNSPARTWIAEHPSHPLAPKLKLRIAEQASAVHVPHDKAAAGAVVRRVVHEARVADEMPVLLLDRLPRRACDKLPAKEYREWVNEVAESVSGESALIIVEPQVALTSECGTKLTPLIDDAIASLDGRHTTLAVGVGDEPTKPESVAARLRRLNHLGLVQVLVSNVGQTSPTKLAARHAFDVLGHLPSLKTGRRFVLVDTSSNGSNRTRPNDTTPRVGGREYLSGDASRTHTLWLTEPGTGDKNFNPERAAQLLGIEAADTEDTTTGSDNHPMQYDASRLHESLATKFAEHPNVVTVALEQTDETDRATWYFIVTIRPGATPPKLTRYHGLPIKYVEGAGYFGQ